jgi:hypothetical protein
MTVPYKQVFARLYTADALHERTLGDVFTLLPDGRLSIGIETAPDLVDIGVSTSGFSSEVLSGELSYQEAQTPDGRYHVQVETFEHQGTTEFWLIHTDHANGKFKRAKLNTEWRLNGRFPPRVTVSPAGSFFLVDDSGIVRLYSSAHLLDSGTFQVAHANTDNRIIALAVSADERLIAALSSWKDIVVYNVPERRVAFVRQIKDTLGWYNSTLGHILITQNAEAIITVGATTDTKAQEAAQCSVNAFKFIPLTG